MNEVKNKTELKVNLSTYYILPLLKLNMSSYGEDNFIKSQVTKYGEVVVYIKSSEVAGDYYNHENLIADVEEEDGSTMIIYSLADRWLEDYQYFLESKYSKMSMFAKDLIFAHAKANGLKYKEDKYAKVVKGKNVELPPKITSRQLAALDSELMESLRLQLEAELDCKISKNQELQSKLNLEEEIVNLN